MLRKLVVLGSTGSIGRQTLDIVRELSDKVTVFGLAARSNGDLLRQQADEFRPAMICLENDKLRGERPGGSRVLSPSDGMIDLVTQPDVDLVVVATSGRAGLAPTLAALDAGKLVALANKETLVMAGAIIKERLSTSGGSLVPIDSEHSAIWQCLQGEPEGAVERLTLTASGGALRHLALEQLQLVTPDEALRHPTWNMGRKITIDSANLMNKGLEVIEARWLFNISLDRVDVVMHSQSIVHSLVTFSDGATKAQLGLPDMRLPIQYALSHPERWPNTLPRLDLTSAHQLTFGSVDTGRYPALKLAVDAGHAAGTYPAVLSAADDVAVEAFLEGRITFTSIPEVVEGVLGAHESCSDPGLDDIIESDRWARTEAERIVSRT